MLMALVVGALLGSCKPGTGGAGTLANQTDSIAYALGLSLAEQTSKDGVMLDPAMLEKGCAETVAGTSSFNDASFQALMQTFSIELQGRQGKPFTAEDAPVTNMDSVSYAIGFNVAKGIKDIQDTYEPKLIAQGYADGIKEGEGNTLITSAEMSSLMQVYGDKQQAAFAEKQAAEGAENEKAGAAFLAENKDKEGVKTTASGLQYKVIREGAGASPSAENTVTAHYEGRLLDGTIFDSSYERGQPADFPLNRVIPGWTEGLQLMKKGSKFQFYIPQNIAYGERGSPPKIGAKATLIFDVELIDFK
ncbi:MAG: FKBP-type peptidyl-prolyl cis-trans isomerase N-terminal domain-containing protein [Bacteroidia bacterium]